MSIWQTTGVGSLPFVDCFEAIQYVVSSYSIPFYPQLVKHERYSASTLPQMLQEAIPKSILNLFANKSTTIEAPFQLAYTWEQEIPSHVASLPGIDAFSSEVSKCKSSYFKLQHIGPKTAVYLLERLYGKKFNSETKQVIVSSLNKYGQKLREICHSDRAKAILMLDEPLGPDPEYFKAFNIENTLLGVHCCGKFSFGSIIDQMKSKYLSFDINQHVIDKNLFSNIEMLQSRGGVMLGIVDTAKQSIDEKSCRILSSQLVEQLQLASGKTQLRPIILTGGCGTGMQTIAFEKQLSTLLRELS